MSVSAIEARDTTPSGVAFRHVLDAIRKLTHHAGEWIEGPADLQHVLELDAESTADPHREQPDAETKPDGGQPQSERGGQSSAGGNGDTRNSVLVKIVRFLGTVPARQRHLPFHCH